MYVHRKAKLCFLASPRTASRAVKTALTQPAIGFTQQGAHHDGPEHGYSIQGYRTFTAVRNHWDTVVSWWFNSRMNRKVEQPSLRWLAKHFSHNEAYFRVGTMFWFRFVPGVVTMRYESLETDLNRILAEAGLPTVKLPVKGVSEERERRHYSTFYDSETRRFVEWCFAPEIMELGYTFEEKPRWTK